jgi:hypothetical protein
MDKPDCIETDYLIVGAGASAMAFVDTLLTEDAMARVIMVDRRDRQGGHWNDAYPFVRPHQPAAWYGVASKLLETGAVDPVGINAGMSSLASGAEVLAYDDEVMQQRFLPSGRVRFMAMCEYQQCDDATHLVRSLVNGATTRINVRRKLVDATHARTEVPSTHPPKYEIDPGVTRVPLNALPHIERPHPAYTVVGSGKTGIDACLWLLEHGVDADRIRWIRPRDAWYLDRGNFQPGLEHFERFMANAANQFDAIVEASSLMDLLTRLEACGVLVRIDPTVKPTTYRCGTVSQPELALLRRIKDVVRLGHLRRVKPMQIALERGNVPAHPYTLYVDCSAGAIQIPPQLPVFEEDRINLLMVRWCQPLFSMALIAYVEAHYDDRACKNGLCTVVPSPEFPADWLRMWAATLGNMARWRADPGLNAWQMQCRLNANAVMMRGVAADDEARMALLRSIGEKSQAAAKAIPALLATLDQRVEQPA